MTRVALAVVLLLVGPAAVAPARDQPCDQDRAADVLRDYAAAVSRGDVGAAMARIARPAPAGAAGAPRAFKWFSVRQDAPGERRDLGFLAYDRRILRPAPDARTRMAAVAPGRLDPVRTYLQGRVRAHERLRVVHVSARPAADLVNFTVRLRRTATDLRPRSGASTTGKGAIDCASGRLAVWSIGTSVR